MSSSFDFINGVPIDLSLQEHRDIVIKRNIILNKALEKGVELSKIKFEITLKVEMECLKCGNNIEECDTEKIDEYDLFNYEVTSNVPKLKCSNPKCQTRYKFDYEKEIFHMSIPSPKKTILKKTTQ